MTARFDEIIDGLSDQELAKIEPDFEQGIWSHVAAIEQKQSARGRNGVAAVMLIVALGAGILTGGQKAYASDDTDILSGGADYSPATLLHVTL
ncbi:hypothetical protein MNBD_ALPHA04-1307 [hydrothermal vent metagenome]|uniref:Uncharacterized protein n=1 Tax=hydrothermal vent metagenome TaxID=652676 RepID=A0A3B0R6G6_9ZZZZ